jgi:segregation and condensation protein B
MKNETPDLRRIKSIIESLLIVSAEPLSVEEIKKTVEDEWEISSKEILDLLQALKGEYQSQSRGYHIVEIAEKFQLCTDPQNAEWVKNFLQVKHADSLSKPALETLAIIAYRQPITKIEIEGIRGVNVDGMIKKLLEKNLIRTRGKKEVLGHPFLYVTTEKFLEYFGLRSLEDLPQREELTRLVSKRENIPVKPVQNEEVKSEQPSETSSENRSN